MNVIVKSFGKIKEVYFDPHIVLKYLPKRNPKSEQTEGQFYFQINNELFPIDYTEDNVLDLSEPWSRSIVLEWNKETLKYNVDPLHSDCSTIVKLSEFIYDKRADKRPKKEK